MCKPRTYLGATAVLAILAFMGCQNSASPMAQTLMAPQKAIVVNSGNGGSTTVFIPSSDPNEPTVMCASGTYVCPECKAAAIKYFATGELDPKCHLSGATRTAITLVPAVGNE